MSGLYDSLMKRAKSVGDQASSFADKVTHPGDTLSQLMDQKTQQGSQQGGQQGGGNWQQYATPQGGMQQPQQQQDPMYGQMMQQVMQNQQPQQPQRQMMTPATMPQMPGNIAPQNNFASLIQRLLGGR
jgi:hypothetical protein